MTPRPPPGLGPLARDATPEQTAAHDQQTAETARYKLGKITASDADGYHRVMCPAAMGKLRCPLRPPSMSLTRQRPEILTPPAHPPACCTQLTITVPPEVNAKTAQKHDYPSQAHRYSYARRSAAERTFSTAKDPASNDISRGWCRLMGLTSITLFAGCLLVVRNLRILAAFDARQAQNAHRAAAGLPPKTRRRRRKTLTSLATRHNHPAQPAQNPQRRPPPPRSGDPACPQPGHLTPRNSSLRPERPSSSPATARAATARRLSEPNVKIVPGKT
jgi:hypothetical protein